LSRLLLPRLSLKIPPEVRSLRSAVVVCNHLSYLDPLLMIALFRRHKTIVKAGFFRVPVFGWMLRQAGFMPPAAAENAALMITQLERMEQFFASGGLLFIFPEGTRSRDGHIGPFHRGAFKIAGRRCLPVEVLVIRNTQALFRPGKFLFAATRRVCIRVELAGTLPPDQRSQTTAVAQRMLRTREILEQHLQASDAADTAGA
jgi:1-acyl-sn-glycerol-3-phosphate acyltransferase